MAIKKVNLTNLPQEECYNINREALYLESLKHKNIIRFKDSFIYENEFYNVFNSTFNLNYSTNEIYLV